MICSRVSARGLTSCASHEFVKITDAFRPVNDALNVQKQSARVHAGGGHVLLFAAFGHIHDGRNLFKRKRF